MDMMEFPEKSRDEVPAPRRIGTDDVADNGVVEFQCFAEERAEIPDPQSAADDVPDWYRTLSPKLMEPEEGVVTTPTTGKQCAPFGEALTAGWLLRSPGRIELVKEGEDVTVSDATDEEFVTVLDTDGRADGSNSTFHMPDVLVDLRWAVNTPPGYGVLITPALNRTELGIEPTSYYYVPEGATDERPFVELAAYAWDEEVTIEKGRPLVSVIPFPDETTPGRARVGPLANDSPVRRVQQRNDNRLNVRPSFYRKEIWCPRDGAVLRDLTSELETERSDGGDGDAPERRGESSGRADPDAIARERRMTFERYEAFEDLYDDADTITRLGTEVPAVPDGSVELLGRELYYESIPRPVSGTQYVQQWHQEMDAEVPAIGESAFPIAESIVRAMSLGFIVRNDADLFFERDPDVPGRYTVSAKAPDEFNSATVQDDRIIGSNHPDMPMTITNVNSRWLYRSPPGVSSLFLPPMNHFQSRYRSFAGLVETDDWYGFLNVPGRLRNDADEIVLRRGNPLIQVIPYRRGGEILAGRITHRRSA